MPSRREFVRLGGLALAGGLAGCSDSLGDGRTETGSPTDGGTDATPTGTASGDGSTADSPYQRVYDQTIGSVVLVRTPEGSLGTGFAFRPGHVATNAHVVGDADRVELQFSRGQTVVGRVEGADGMSDLAAVRATGAPDYVQPLSFAESEPAVGTKVAVIGSPYGLRGSLSSGVVSAVDRLIPNPRAEFVLPNAIQTDAPVNPGNSGGPLSDMSGTVLGVVNSGGGDNIAFAISAAMARRVLPALVETGDYVHPYLGADLLKVTDVVARANDLDRPRGLLVVETADGSPAAATLQASDSQERIRGFTVPTGGDVVLAIGDRRVSTRQDFLSYLLLQTSPGDTVDLRVVRDGERRTVTAELAARPGG